MTSTPPAPYPILLVDDEEAWLHSFSLSLRSAGLANIVCCADSGKVMGLLHRQPAGVVVLDLTMPPPSGEELLSRIVQEQPDTPVIIVTGLDLVDTAVRCMKLGAFDYYTKVSEEERLIAGIRRALDFSRLRQENTRLREHFLSDRLERPEAFSAIITRSRAMHSIFRYMEAIAQTTEPVLISGETGVGKELVARALHDLSGRPGRLVPVNIAGLDDSMFADTMFGHQKGAYTGADRTRPGLVEQAGGGTLFLDEIGDLSPACQIKLLRLIQEREYLPLGADVPKRTDCRMVFASHHRLHELQERGDFRKDLYYRLHAHHVHVPSLRERREDLPLLLDHFLAEAAASLGRKPPAYPRELLALLNTYPFPGNIRELKNMAFDAVSSQRQRMLSMAPFADYIRRQTPDHGRVTSLPPEDGTQTPFSQLDSLPTLKEAGSLLVREALRRASGNQAIAARMLGITRQALNWRLKKETES